MRIFNLTEDSKLYTSNVYFVLGEWNTLSDTNTLIDVGSDPLTIEKLNAMNTGLGKRKVDQVILTHSHSDHAAILPEIIQHFNPVVYAFNVHLKGVNHVIKDGDSIRIGEKYFEVIHLTLHSYDSVCLYCEEDGLLFSGDTNFPLEFENGQLKDENQYAVSRLSESRIRTIYPGHGPLQHYITRRFRLLKT